jgi:hypothetical protein
VIRKTSWGSTEYRRLGYIDWHVNYKTDVTPNYANPSASVLAPAAGSGGTIDATVKGVGVSGHWEGLRQRPARHEDHQSEELSADGRGGVIASPRRGLPPRPTPQRPGP